MPAWIPPWNRSAFVTDGAASLIEAAPVLGDRMFETRD